MTKETKRLFADYEQRSAAARKSIADYIGTVKNNHSAPMIKPSRQNSFATPGLRAVREAAGLNIEDLAARLRCEPGDIYRLERKDGRATRATIYSIAQAIGCRGEDIVT